MAVITFNINIVAVTVASNQRHVLLTRQIQFPRPFLLSVGIVKRPQSARTRAMPPKANTEQSIRYLPDLSDTSFSFQIPAESSSAEFLLADNSSDLDFLRGAGGASFATIAPTPARGKLKPSDATPKATSQLLSLSRSTSPSPSAHQKNDYRPLRSRHQSPVKATKMSRPPSKLKEIVLDRPAVSEERLESLRAEVGSLNDDDNIPMHVEPPAVARSSVLNVTAAPISKLKPRTRINSVS